MRQNLIVSPKPVRELFLYLFDCFKDIPVLPFMANRAVVALDISVLLRLSGLDILDVDAHPGGQVLSGTMIAVAGELISHFHVIPKALRAGGKGRIEAKEASTEGSVTDFAIEGSGPSPKFWHQTVVAMVVVILVGLIVHVNGVLGLV